MGSQSVACLKEEDSLIRLASPSTCEAKPAFENGPGEG